MTTGRRGAPSGGGAARDRAAPVLCYCTNFAAAASAAAMLARLRRFAEGLREHGWDRHPIEIGLWLPAGVLPELEADGGAAFFGELAAMGLAVATFNAFPHGAFHGPVVKRAVYEPGLADPRRHAYLEAIAGLAERLGRPWAVPVSTVPIGWGRGADGGCTPAALGWLAAWEARHAGRGVELGLEPEPGCVIGSAADTPGVLGALAGGAGPASRRRVGVCHDVCHSAVMREPQAEAFAAYDAAGARVNKVQISSAPSIGPGRLAAALAAFDEPRYLHQTTLRDGRGVSFFEDAADALARVERLGPEADARVHFHVPVHLDRLELGGGLSCGTTSGEVSDAVREALRRGVRVFEVETYAWDVLPGSVRGQALGGRPMEAGIADELRWAEGVLAQAFENTDAGAAP